MTIPAVSFEKFLDFLNAHIEDLHTMSAKVAEMQAQLEIRTKHMEKCRAIVMAEARANREGGLH